MYKLLSIIILSLFLQGCGGADAQLSTTPVPALNGAEDANSKALKAIRDVSSASGGRVGFVNSALYAHTITGAYETSFEWTSLSILDNHSLTGENVATYAQCNVFSTGPCWGAVSEVTDTRGTASAIIAHEFDTFATGPDNGNRIGLDIFSGDAKYVRGMGKSEKADSSIALRIGQTSSTPWATWGTGIVLQGNYRDSVIKIVAPNGQVLFEIKPNGDIYRRGVLLP
jgi:hypothetical protein